MEIIFIRHTSVDVPSGTCYGQTDVPLRPTFEQEAAVILEKLNVYAPFDQVYTSPLSRCTRLAAYCGYPDAERDYRILELDFGDWEMRRFDDIKDDRLQEWYDDYLNVSATNGESFFMQYKRVAHFLDELKTKPYRKVVIFTHGGVLICAQIYAGLLDFKNAFTSLTPYGGMIHLSISSISE